MTATAKPRPMSILYWMALGTFAIGTEGFMIAPLLPNLAEDLSVGLVAAGQLVTVFTLSYAFSSPILTALTGGISRRNLLIISMAGFAVANVVAALAPNYWMLMAARVLLALAAGLYVPNANALAGAVVAPEKRGTALSIVTGGTSIAVALGVPISALIGHSFGWRLTFVVVGTLSVLATMGLVFGLERDVGAGSPVASLRERIVVVSQKSVLLMLLVTLLWATGAYAVYTYLSVFLASEIGIDGAHVSLVLFMWGVSAAAGIFVGGTLTDRYGARPVIVLSLLFLALAFASLSVSSTLLSTAAAVGPVLVGIVIWGLSAWAFFPAQQTRLMGIAGIKVAPIALSLNASFMFLGFSLGAALGSLTLTYAAPSALGWVGSLCVLASLLVSIRTMHTTVAAA
jgi:predicted MFS family arabinose efflux permease